MIIILTVYTTVSINVDTWPNTTGDVTYGTTVILTCRISGDDVNNAIFKWNCPNGTCSISSGESVFNRRVHGNRMTVTVVNPVDLGVYNCTVTDNNGNLTGSASYGLITNGMSILSHSSITLKL